MNRITLAALLTSLLVVGHPVQGQDEPLTVSPIIEAAQHAAELVDNPEHRVNALLKVAEAWARAGEQERALQLIGTCNEMARSMKDAATWEKKIAAASRRITTDLAGESLAIGVLRNQIQGILTSAEQAFSAGKPSDCAAALARVTDSLPGLASYDQARYGAEVALQYARLGVRRKAEQHLNAAQDALAEMPAMNADGTRRILAMAQGALGDFDEAVVTARDLADRPARIQTLFEVGRELFRSDAVTGRTVLRIALEEDPGMAPSRRIEAIRATLAGWRIDEPAEPGTILARAAEDLAREMSPGPDRDNALRNARDAYEAVERWDDALSLARLLGDEAAICRIQAHRAIWLADAGQPSAAVATMRELHPEFVKTLDVELLAAVGQAYARIRPEEPVAEVATLTPVSVRNAALKAMAELAVDNDRPDRALNMALAMQREGRMPEPRSIALEEIPIRILHTADKESLDTALALAQRAADNLHSPLKRQSLQYRMAVRLLRAGRTDEAAAIVPQLLANMDLLDRIEHRAELRLRSALIRNSLGNHEAGLADAQSAMRLLPSVGCGSCIVGVAAEVLPEFVAMEQLPLLEQALETLTTSRALSIFQTKLIEYAKTGPGLSDPVRADLLRIALKVATLREYADDRCDTLLYSARAYVETGISPGPDALAIVGAAPLPAEPPEQSQMDSERPGNAPKPLQSSDSLRSSIVLFTVKHCADCEHVKEMLDSIHDRRPTLNVELQVIDLDDPGALALNLALGEMLGVREDKRGEAPTVFSAVGALTYERVNEESLGDLIAEATGLKSPLEMLPEGTSVEPIASQVMPATEGPRISDPAGAMLTFFSKYGCGRCKEAEKAIDRAKELVKDVRVDVRKVYVDNQAGGELCVTMLNALGISAGVSAPVLVSAESALLHQEITVDAVADMIRSAKGKAAPEVALGGNTEAGSARMKRDYEKVTLALVVVAALADGIINPCAFTVIIFFIAYLTHIRKDRDEILLAGITFLLAVFATYLALGIGLQRLLAHAGNLTEHFSNIVMTAMSALLVLAAVLSFRDALAARRGQERTMALRLPDRLQSFIRKRISRQARLRLTIGTTLMLGALVAAVELPCTGIMYIPVLLLITWAIQHGGYGFSPYAQLLIYNLVFVAPLVLVFVAIYFGVTSEQIARAFRKRMVAFKIAIGVVFLLLAFALVALPVMSNIE